MDLVYHKNFLKDIERLSGNNILLNLENIIFELKELESLNSYKNAKKLKGFLNYYRIRIGNYRIGLRFENNKIILDRFLHRKDIYKKYP